MKTIPEIREIVKRLSDYVRCQRTDFQPIFMSRLLKGIKELEEATQLKKSKRKTNENKKD